MTDASEKGMEAVLSQLQDREERAISYYSKTLAPPERITEVLAKFHYTLKHRAGIRHRNTDGLRHRGCEDCW